MSTTRCQCKLKDCAFYNAVPESDHWCDCSHTDKQYYMTNPCPLYRKDWAVDGTDRSQELKERFLLRRKK